MMRIKLYIAFTGFILGALPLIAQTTYVPLWAKEGWLLDRMEIKARNDNDLNLSTVKPYMRKAYVSVADSFRQMLLDGNNPAALTLVDQYNLDRFQANNSEFSRFNTTSMPGWKSKKTFLGAFWATKGNMVEVNEKDFYLSVNPVMNQQQSIETDYNDRVYVNAKGLTARGLIANKIGFHFYLTDNQEQGPLPFRQYVDSNRVVPGAGFWKTFKDNAGVDYFDARGSVTWSVTRHVNMQFGYDQQFIGSGYRSLFLSNFAPPNLFLKFNTRFWKLNYTNLFSEMYANRQITGDVLLPKKYVSMHHLSMNVLPWLTVGAFESTVFAQPNTLKLSHLQPVIFANSLAASSTNGNNANVGFDVKANIAGKVQLYGQYLFDGVVSDEKKQGTDWWGSRHGFQAGAKYVDALGIKNLDLQAEINQVRPFTYSGEDSVVAYINYQQPLAHPMGGNLREVIGIARYQPTPKLYFFARVNYWKQGLDSAGFNFGANPIRLNTAAAAGGARLRNDSYPLLAGTPSQGLNSSITASYELKENLFLDLSGMVRVFKKEDLDRVNTTVVTLGLRWNMFRRDYDY